MRLAGVLVAAALAGVVALLWLVAPSRLDPRVAEAMDAAGDAKAGEIVFYAGGCAGCHAADPDQPTRLAGGRALVTPFGTLSPANISPDPNDGLGRWSAQDFARAVYDGVGRDNRHEYPAFPYPSYRRMAVADVRDLWAFLRTVPPVGGAAAAPQLRFPFNLRPLIGLWKRLYLPRLSPPETVTADDTAAYGGYLVRGAGHCGECHTPRDALGGPIASRPLAGAPLPDGKGKAPDITPAGLKNWSEDDLETALTTGITPDGDTLGGPMAEVVRNLARLPKADVTAIARYLKRAN